MRIRAWLSRGRRRGGGQLAPTQPPVRRVPAPQPGCSPRLPVRSDGCSAPPHGYARPGRLESSPAPGPARFPERPKIPVAVGDQSTPWSLSLMSSSPGRPEHGPNAATVGGQRGQTKPAPRQSPSACESPGSPVKVPGALSCSPTGRGYRRAGQSVPRRPLPRELPYVHVHPAPPRRQAPASRPAARFCFGLLPARSRSRTGRENNSLHRQLNGAGTSLGVNSRPPVRCRAVPAGRAGTRGPHGTDGPRQTPVLPRAGGSAAAGTLPFRFRAARGEAGSQRPAPSCGTCTLLGNRRPRQDRPTRDRGRGR